MGRESVEELLLAGQSPAQDVEDAAYAGVHRQKRYGGAATREKALFLIVVLQALALVLGILVYKNRNLQEGATCNCRSYEPLVYSPADSVVEYEVKAFTAGRENKTIYQGLNDEADQAWEELYYGGIMKIPRNEAMLLPNKTYPIKDSPGYYLGGLDVFHQLHCLNNVRRALHPERYGNDTDLDAEHVSHCVDTIRQSLMCNADTSINVWQWSDELSAVVGYSTQAHSCKNFDKLREWAQARRVHKWIDTLLYVEDDLPDPPIIS